MSFLNTDLFLLRIYYEDSIWKSLHFFDTNCDPEELDYVIPGNDDAIRAVKLIVSKMADAVIEANQGQTDAEGEIQAESEEFATEE